MTPEEIARIQAIARADAQADIDKVRASGLDLTWENAKTIEDLDLKQAFLRQLDAQNRRRARHLDQEFNVS